MSIPEAQMADIERLCAEGDGLVEQGQFGEAYKSYMAALQLVPEPAEQFEATTWILAALGDLYFGAADYHQVVTVLSDAMHCPGAIGNPFLHLRLGQAQLEVGNEERAADELCRAYMGGGGEIFEEDDPKYFAFLKTRIQPPAGGW
ncbi:tetratricopeptide repeat protein [Dyella sp. 2RAB6]|uniref:tetratricopeptide repeat protein n=1 Tax=Dyella sp. 2RAB6 TaxID=3232992 RepID=UPI003F91BEF6